MKRLKSVRTKYGLERQKFLPEKTEILAKVGEVVGNVEVAVHGGMEAVVQSIANHKLVWNSTETWTEPSEWLELRLFALSSKSSKSEKNL